MRPAAAAHEAPAPATCPAATCVRKRRLHTLLTTAVRAFLVAAFGGLPASDAHAGYIIENVAYPSEIQGGISAVTFTPEGELVISTRLGDVWIRGVGPNPGWRRFMRGLDEPTGIVADSERVLTIAHRPEVLRATDTDGDGRADTFDVLGGQWGLSINYHEFFFGLKRDRAGNFYGAPSLDSALQEGDPNERPVRGTRNYEPVLEPSGHRSDTPWRGWVVRVTPDGQLEPLASGFRQPNGIGLSPDDDLFVTDNQGDYKASTGLLHVAPGDFHGHAASLKWEHGYDAGNVSTELIWRRHKSPAVVFPHGPMGISPGEPVWDVTGGRFGPFAGQVFTGDYSALMVRASLERIGDTWQGACYAFLGRNDVLGHVSGDRLKSGITRAAFAPDGSLYLAATAGWGAGEDGLQRITWDGVTTPEIRDLTLTRNGFIITFTRPMSAATLEKVEGYTVNRFRYYYHVKYGSPRIDEARVGVIGARAAPDRLSVELVFEELRAGFVYEVSVPTLRTTAGEPLANPLAYYTAKRLLQGEEAIGGTTRLPFPHETAAAAREGAIAELASPAGRIATGEKVYRMYCVGCHQPDGRGVEGGAANFVDDQSRLAKEDAELLNVITRGNELKGMPAFGEILSAGESHAVLEYIRSAFGGN